MTIQGGGVSKSATKAPWAGISREKKRGISTILFARSGPIRAFVADLDNLAPSRAPGGAATGRPATTTGTPASERGPRAASPASPDAARRRDVHFALESAVPTVTFECKMHLSTRKRPMVILRTAVTTALKHLQRPGEKGSMKD